MKIDTIEHTLNGYRALHPAPANYETLAVWLSRDWNQNYTETQSWDEMDPAALGDWTPPENEKEVRICDLNADQIDHYRTSRTSRLPDEYTAAIEFRAWELEEVDVETRAASLTLTNEELRKCTDFSRLLRAHELRRREHLAAAKTREARRTWEAQNDALNRELEALRTRLAEIAQAMAIRPTVWTASRENLDITVDDDDAICETRPSAAQAA